MASDPSTSSASTPQATEISAFASLSRALQRVRSESLIQLLLAWNQSSARRPMFLTAPFQ
jgi:hypothetical protein